MAPRGTDLLVQSYLASETPATSHIPAELAESIAAGESTLLGVVKALGPILTSEQDSVRARGECLLFLLSLVSGASTRLLRPPLSRRRTACSSSFSAIQGQSQQTRKSVLLFPFFSFFSVCIITGQFFFTQCGSVTGIDYQLGP
jgi:hypothetical protein